MVVMTSHQSLTPPQPKELRFTMRGGGEVAGGVSASSSGQCLLYLLAKVLPILEPRFSRPAEHKVVQTGPPGVVISSSILIPLDFWTHES